MTEVTDVNTEELQPAEESGYVMTFSDPLVGIPTMCLVQARNYKFAVSTDSFRIKVPMTGTYQELDPEYFTEDSGEFTIYDGKDINISTLSKVLFAARKYPNLADGQVFCPLKIVVESTDIIVYGQVVQLLNDNSDNEDALIEIVEE